MVTSGLNCCQDLFLILRLEGTIQRLAECEGAGAFARACFQANKIGEDNRTSLRHPFARAAAIAQWCFGAAPAC